MELSEGSELEIATNLDRLTSVINTLVGKNFVPSYPAYIVAVLQAYEAAVPVDLSASTHGYFYELLIRAALSRERDRSEYDIALAYLAHLAYSMFRLNQNKIAEDELRAIDDGYQSKYDIRINGRDLRARLVKQGILAVSDGHHRFRYPYAYYYFVASFIRDHMHDLEVLDVVKALANRIYHQESANILLFLAHLSKDPVIIQELLAASDRIHPTHKPADLIEESTLLADIGVQPIEISYEERDPSEVREKVLESLDEADRRREIEQSGEPDDTVDPSNPLSDIIKSARALEILGQILKNFPGSLEGNVKLSIASRCWDMGLKTLKVIFEVLQETRTPLLNNLFEAFRSDYPHLSEQAVWERARETAVGIVYVVSFSTIKKISQSVGSPELATTYDKVLAQWEVPSTQLVHLSLQLDQSGFFPRNQVERLADDLESNVLATSILRMLIVNHFYLFPVDFRTKQGVCTKLDVPYKEMQHKAPTPRLLPEPHR